MAGHSRWAKVKNFKGGIDHAIRRGTGEGESVLYEDLANEVYGPHGVAIEAKGVQVRECQRDASGDADGVEAHRVARGS
jgi:hypothetical protein